MLRKSLSILFFLFLINVSKAQVIEVLSGIVEPRGLALNGNDLYISNGGDKISKIDITDPNQTVTDVVSGLSLPQGLLLHENDLYIAEFQAQKISKIDISESNPTATDVVTGISIPVSLMLNGNDLYISSGLLSGAEIFKIDITETNPTATVVVSGLYQPSGMVLHGNDLYIAQEQYAGSIVKIDITETNPTITHVVGENELLIQPSGLVLYGNDLFIAENHFGDIKKIDITEPEPIVDDVIIELSDPNFLMLVENEMYFSEYGGNRVSKINLDLLLLDDFSKPNALKVYPNPASNFIQVSGLNNSENYKIVNMLGTELKAGKISDSETINIESLITGVYFLNFENGNILKFIKE